MRYILIIAALFCSLPQISAQNNITYGAGISYTNGAPSFTPPARTSRVAIDTVTGKWYHYNTPGGWQLLGNTIEEIAGCSAPAYTPTKGDSKVVINNCTSPELYYWTGSAWVWINEGTTYYAGEGIRIQNDSIILDSLYYLQFRTGDTTDLNAGRLSWNAQEGTLDVVINSGNVTGQIFEDVFFNCKNQTGSTITRGTVVMAVGTLGASGRILIAPAIADGSVNSEYILGTAAQDIANGADGLVYHFGKDRDLNTTGASCGETWADRDVLYCSATTPGCLTKTIPTAPNLKVPVAIVLNAASNGTLFVRPSHFPDLNQINDVQLTSPTTGQTLIYNSITGVWSNQTLSVSPAGSNGQVQFNNSGSFGASSNFIWDNSNNRLGVGTSVVNAGTFNVRGATTSTSEWTAQFHNSGGGSNSLMVRDDGRVGIGTSTMTQTFNIGGTSYFNSTVFLNGNVNDNRGNGFIVQSANTVASNRDLTIGNAIYRRILLNAQGLYLGTSFPASPYLFYINGGTATSTVVNNPIYLRPTQPQAGGNTAGGDIIMMLPDGTGTARKGAVLVGTETATGPSAIIEFSSTDRGVLFPRMTTTERNAITTPADGLVIYNTTDNKLQVRAAGAWVDLH